MSSWLLVGSILLLLPAQGPAAHDGTASVDTVAVPVVMPEPVGGVAAVARRVRAPVGGRRLAGADTVWVRTWVTPQGRATRVVVLRGIEPAIDSAVVAAVRRSKFAPARRGEAAVGAEVVLAVRWTPRERLPPPPLRRGPCERRDC